MKVGSYCLAVANTQFNIFCCIKTSNTILIITSKYLLLCHCTDFHDNTRWPTLRDRFAYRLSTLRFRRTKCICILYSVRVRMRHEPHIFYAVFSVIQGYPLPGPYAINPAPVYWYRILIFPSATSKRPFKLSFLTTTTFFTRVHRYLSKIQHISTSFLLIIPEEILAFPSQAEYFIL